MPSTPQQIIKTDKNIMGRPQGSPNKTKYAESDTERMNMRLLFAVRKNFKPMYAAQIERAKHGSFPAFQYLLDRVLGKPVESIKIVQAIKLIMDE